LPGEESEEDAAPALARDYSLEKAENFLAAYMETIAKERNRNVEWVVQAVRESVAIGEDEALELNVIDLVAEDREELLEALEGREVRVAGKLVTLEVANASIVTLEMSTLQSLFNFLSDPNVALVLFLAGLAGLYIEFNSPGLILPGVAGAICLILTAIAFQILPFSWVGLILILAGVGLLIAEIFVTSFGVLFAAGIGCFLLGGTMIFDQPEMSDLTVSFWSVLVPAVLAVAIFGAIIVFSIGRTFGLEQTAGVGELVGLVGKAATPLDLGGKVFIRGEYWNAEAEQLIGEGEAVEVVAVDGLKLKVRGAAV
jgi:membrane-bound serine protease (ClpP class)